MLEGAKPLESRIPLLLAVLCGAITGAPAAAVGYLAFMGMSDACGDFSPFPNMWVAIATIAGVGAAAVSMLCGAVAFWINSKGAAADCGVGRTG
jgi:hypothetical protein